MYSIFTNVYLLDENKIFLLHRAPGKAVWPDTLLGVGGKVEPGEDVREAAIREFQEEAGATVTDLKLIGTLSWIDGENQNGINYIFVAHKYTGQLLSSCDEGKFEWIDIRDVMVDSRTAAHQLRYLPYLANGEHFSQHMHFEGPFSKGAITKDFNSITYTNHRIAKNAESVGVSTGNLEKLDFIGTILTPYAISVSQKSEGISVDVAIHTADTSLNELFKNGVKKSVEDAGIEFTPENAIDFYTKKISSPMRAVLEYAVGRGDESRVVLIPAWLTNTPSYNESIRDNFFWSFLQFSVDDEMKSYVDLTPEEKSSVFGLLAQATMRV